MARPPRSTIRDVAAAAGVSLTTVSDALSGKGRLPSETRRKVSEVAEQLNYRPSAIARGLRGQGLGLVGLSIAPARSATLTAVSYWGTIAMHASDAILAEGFAPVLLPHRIASLAKLHIPLDGAILVDPFENDEVLAFLRDQRVNAVTIGRDVGNPQGSWVDDDTEGGMFQLLDLTVRPGERIAAITLGPPKSYVADALRGALRWCEATESAMTEHHVEDLHDRFVDTVLGRSRQWGATVVLAQNDRLATKALSRLGAMGLKVPQEIRVVSATDAPDLEHVSPSVTALRQHPGRLGELAAEVLFDKMHGVSLTRQHVLPMEVVIRASAPRLDRP